MVFTSQDNLCNTISLRFPSCLYPTTSPLHSLIEQKEWQLVLWRVCGIDWDEIRRASHVTADTEVFPFDNLFKRIQRGDGFTVSPHLSNLSISSIPEVSFPRFSDGKLPLHLAVDNDAPPKTLKMLLGHHFSLIRCYSEQHGLPLYYACHSLTFDTSLRRRFAVIDCLIREYPHAAFIKSPNGDFPLHAVMRNRPNAELIGIFLSLERDGSGLTSPVLGLLADEDGQLPLHIGLEYNAPEEAIRSLLNFYPQAAGHRRHLDGKLPSQLVNASIISDSLFHELLRMEECVDDFTTYG